MLLHDILSYTLPVVVNLIPLFWCGDVLRVCKTNFTNFQIFTTRSKQYSRNKTKDWHEATKKKGLFKTK